MIKILNSLTDKQLSKTEKNIFYVEESLNPLDCKVEISGMGKLNFPVSTFDVKTLLSLSSKAPFGLKEKTLLDMQVRDSNKIDADQLTIRFQDNTLDQALNRIKMKMKLPETSKLKAELHNMLIYGPGQFFKQHQDSEKLDGMIATLVMILPCAHIGGDLIVKHQNHKHKFISENLNNFDIKCIIFYSDCQHEVKKIREGHRIALTFNVVLENSQDRTYNNVNDNLKKELSDYFSTIDDSGNRPDIFAYILEHEYTTHSLRWNLLKGNDHINSGSFLYAAKQLNLVPHLALIEIYQSWSTNYNMYDDDIPELQEIITEDQTLSSWVDINNNKLPYREYAIDGKNICYSIALSDLEASNSEYEGWMGNYGNTVDYWYKKAAIILWPQDIDIQMKFALDRGNQIQKLLTLTESPGNEAQVLDIIKQAHHYILHNSNHQDSQKELNIHLLKIAIYIDDPDLASYLLSKIAIAEIQEEYVDNIIKLQFKYGVEWCIQLITGWQNYRGIYHKTELIKNLDIIVQNLLAKKADVKLIESLLSYQFNTIKQQDQLTKSYRVIDIRKSQPQRILIVQSMLNIYINSYRNEQMAEQFVLYLIDHPILYPILELFKALEPFHKKIAKPYYTFYKHLINYVINNMDKKLALGPPKDDDWSIDANLRCNCQDCAAVANFLISNDVQKVFAVIKQVREHIIDSLRGMCLPITTEVVKKGSPHKLVLTKTSEMYKEATEYFNKLQAARKKL